MSSIPPATSRNFGDRMREFALVALGLTNNKLDAFVTLRDLKDAGIVNVSARYLEASGGRGTGPGPRPTVVEPAIDLTPPPAPGGFGATSGITQILFETAAPVYRSGHGHSRTKIYAASYAGTGPLPTFSDAVLYTDFPGNIGVAPFDPASQLRLWATWTSADGVESEPAGGINGIAATTGLLEDQHIANVTVGKLLAGSVAVGQYIQSAGYVAGVSGWRIATLSGGGAFVEIRGNAVFGGTIFAGAGEIGGSTIGANYIRSTNYILNTQGWSLNSDGTGQIGGFVVTSTGIQSSGYVAGSSGWRITAAGAIEGANVTLTGGLVRNSTNTAVLNLNASGSGLLLRAGAYANFGPYAGWHYPVEIAADGSAFFGRGAVSGGQLKASGTYSIPDAQRPAVSFDTPPSSYDWGGY